ncbi:cellulase family glycosylhydrolase [Mycobacterium sp. NPDC003323]
MHRQRHRLAAIVATCACVLALVSGVGETRARAAGYAVNPVAAIEERPSTVGIAEGADLYYMSDTDVERTLEAMQSLGVQDVRIAIFWADVEAEEGVFDWTRVDQMVEAAHERGMGILGTMLYTPDWAGAGGLTGHPDPVKWGAFVKAAAERYDGRISAYEIWNEPTTTLFWDPVDPAVYTDLLKAGYQAIKQVDASAVVIAGSVVAGPTRPDGSTMSPVDFLQGMYDAGAHGYFDAISYHPYLFSMPFSGGQNQPHFDYPIEQLDQMRALMVEHGDGALKVWITEYGQPTTTLADGTVLTEAQQAAFIADLLRTWQSVEGAGPVFFYNLRDTQTGDSNPDHNLGLYQSDWTQKEAAEVLAALIKELNPTHHPANPVVTFVKQVIRAVGDAIAFIPELIGRVVRTVVRFVGDVLGVNSTAARTAAAPDSAVAAVRVDEPGESEPPRDRRTVTDTAERAVPKPDEQSAGEQSADRESGATDSAVADSAAPEEEDAGAPVERGTSDEDLTTEETVEMAAEPDDEATEADAEAQDETDRPDDETAADEGADDTDAPGDTDKSGEAGSAKRMN